MAPDRDTVAFEQRERFPNVNETLVDLAHTRCVEEESDDELLRGVVDWPREERVEGGPVWECRIGEQAGDQVLEPQWRARARLLQSPASMGRGVCVCVWREGILSVHQVSS